MHQMCNTCASTHAASGTEHLLRALELGQHLGRMRANILSVFFHVPSYPSASCALPAQRPKRHRLTVSSGPEGLPCAGPAPRGESEHGNQPSSSLAARVLQSSTLAEFDALVAQNDDVLYDLAGALPAEVRWLCAVCGAVYCLLTGYCR